MTEKITIHSMQTVTGENIEYARILRQQGSVIFGYSVMLYRLTKEQLSRARRPFAA